MSRFDSRLHSLMAMQNRFIKVIVLHGKDTELKKLIRNKLLFMNYFSNDDFREDISISGAKLKYEQYLSM